MNMAGAPLSNTILLVDLDQLTEDEKDEISHTLSRENVGDSMDIQELRTLVNLLQGLLRFKVEQVESLGLELDELASKQGQEEALLVQEIEELRTQLSKGPREYGNNGVDNDDDLRQMLQTSEINAQKLLAEVQAQEQEQLSNKMEIEKLESQLAFVENDRLQLKQELSALRDEIQDQHKTVNEGSQEPQKKHRQLVVSLRQKNKHLSLLLNDVETSEKENVALREKLTNIKIELAEATKNIMHTTGEIVTLQITKEEQAEKVRYLEQMCDALRQQVKDLVKDKDRRDSELEAFHQEINVRVQEWKEIVAMKETELNEMKKELTDQSFKDDHMLKKFESEQIALISQTLQKRESQIDMLQSQLSQATKDLNETTSLLENMHKATELSNTGPSTQGAEVTQKQLVAFEGKIKTLEEKLKDAESDADGKSEEITKLIIQLRAYETGEFGLPEALAQIKDLSQQRSVRDKHIEQLVETANMLKNMCDCLQEENLTLREQLKISPEDHVPTSTSVLKNKEQNVMKIQQQQIDRLEEDLISAKIDRRKLSQQVLALSKQLHASEVYPQDTPKSNNKQQTRSQADARATARKIRALQQQQQQFSIERQSLVDENEALRQGLHDILDSVHNQDGKSSVRVESKVLEQLLHALDSRHISGWYHPAMRIQAQVNTVEGNNEALREQLHIMREEESRAQNELQKAKLRIAELEEDKRGGNIPSESNNAKDSSYPKGKVNSAPLSLPAELPSQLSLPIELPLQGWNVISNLNTHLIRVLHEHEIEKHQVSETLGIQRELQQELDALISQLVHVLQQQNSDRLVWQEEKSELESQINILQSNLAASDNQISQLNSLYDKFSTENEPKRSLVETSLSIASLSAEKEKSDRKAQAAQQNANNAKRQQQIMKSEWNACKQWLMRQFEDMLQFKKRCLLRLSDVGLIISESVPVASLKAANKSIDEVTAKYTDLLRQHEIQVSLSDREVKKLIHQLQQEREVKHDLWKQLEEANKRIWARNSELSEQELSAKLAKAIVEVQREKEHASHTEKMSDIVKAVIEQVSKRCKVLEDEVAALLNTNQQLKRENVSLHEALPLDDAASDKKNLLAELANAKAEVVELQASQKHLQELADISQAQVHMLDQLHERSEHQLDTLRQVMFKVQCETDLGAEIVRLSEELVSSQISEMAAWNQVSGLEKQCSLYITEREKQTKEMEELQMKLNAENLKHLDQKRKNQEQSSAMSEFSDNSLPLAFFQLLVVSFTQRSVECRELWYRLLEAKEELEAVKATTEERKISHQQTLELQNALQASHSDLDCQRVIERWASEFTELKIKYLKSTRQCEALDGTLRQTQERLQNQDNLLSSLEQQLLLLDANKPFPTLHKYKDDELVSSAKQIMPLTRTTDKPHNDAGSSCNCQCIPPLTQEASQASRIAVKESQGKESEAPQNDDHLHLKEGLTSLREELVELAEHLKSKDGELESYKNLCHSLQQSLDEQVSQQTNVSHTVPVSPHPLVATNDNQNLSDHDKAALQATVESLQNIIEQKEDTISRYQKILQDVREEDGRIISALQEHLRVQQADLTAQEQAYIKCKISMRHLALEANSNENGSKASLDLHLSRSNELEDEVALLNSKTLGLSSELHQVQQEAVYWKSLAQQHLVTIEELNIRLSEQKSRDKRPSFHETATSSKGNVLITSSDKSLHESQESYKGYRAVDGSPKGKANPIQIQLSAEVAELRSRIHQMEDQERQHKNEIQRLREQIPIYSRRNLHAQNGAVLPEREADLLKRIKFLEHQLEQQKIEHEKILTQRSQQESKKMKSVENVARWDERKKYQIQTERLKSSLREQTDETAILHDKVERMHATVHRLEREKIALEQQIRSLRHLEQDKAILEERLKTLEGNDVPQCIFDELQQERDKLLAEVQMLRAKSAVIGKERNIVTQNLLDGMKLERDKLYSELKILQAKVISDQKHKVEKSPDTQQKERADLQKINLALECQNLELKLELEKLRSEAPCLRHKVMHLERLLQETCEQKSAVPLQGGFQSAWNTEHKNLQLKVCHLTKQLETANHRLKTLESINDYGKVAALQAELEQKSSLLCKVKTLLERAAIKERQLSDQVCRLESIIAKRK